MGKLVFGKSAKGKVVHIIKVEGKLHSALCDKKQINLIIDKSLSPEDVTCAKCKQYACLKEVLIAKNQAAVASKKKVKDKPKATEKKVEFSTVDKNKNQQNYPTPIKKKTKTKIEKEVKKVVVEKKKKKIEDGCIFNKKEKANGLCDIVHIPTRMSFFNNINKEVIDIALENLNNISTPWKEKADKIPKGFITNCRKAIRLAYDKAKVSIPNSLTKDPDPVENSRKKTIKRRDKKETKKSKKTIKRRDKKEKKEKRGKTKKQESIDFILQQMTLGIELSKLIKLVSKTFDLITKKSNGRVKNCIRIMRRNEVKVTIKLAKDKKDDFYKIIT